MNGTVLTLKSNDLLSETHNIVQAVLSESFLCQTLIIDGEFNLFEETFKDEETFKTFWHLLGKSVVVGDLNIKHVPVFMTNACFTNLREIRMHADHANLEFIELCKKNIQLDTIVLRGGNVINISNYDKWNIEEHVFDLLRYCKLLKKFEFSCFIPLEESTINELFAGINYEYLGMDEILFDCEPIPCWNDYSTYYWVIHSIAMEFEKEHGTNKLLIKPLEIEETFKSDENECQDDCPIKHKVFLSKSVKEINFSFDSYKRCRNYLESCIYSFPSTIILNAAGLMDYDEWMVNLILPQLNHISTCYIYFKSSALNWVSLPQVETIAVTFVTTTYESFEAFIKSVPNLTFLEIFINQGITSDDCVKIISDHLPFLSYLSIMCNKSKVTSVGLRLFRKNFQVLEELRIQCPTSDIAIRRLFKKLPKLSKIFCGERYFYKNDQITNDTIAIEEHEMRDEAKLTIEDLSTEIIECIFLNLNKRDQLQCRQVSKRWFDICSSSTQLDRSLSFKDSYLSNNINPVKIFLNTKFNYNRLVFDKDTNFATEDDLTEFWDKIGEHIIELSFIGNALNIEGAFKTGLVSNHLPNLICLCFNNLYFFNELLSRKNIPEWHSILKKIKSLTVMGVYVVTRKLSNDLVFEMPCVEKVEVYYNADVVLNYLSYLTFPNIKTFVIVSESDEPTQSLLKVNFTNLQSLFIGHYEQWKNHGFESICQKFPSLCSLGVCMLGATERTFDVNFCNSVAESFFGRLCFLCKIYFVKFYKTERNILQRKLYYRTSVNEFIVSNEKHHLFDEICLKKLIKIRR